MSSFQICRRGFLGASVAASTLLASSELLARGLADFPAPDQALMVPVEGGRVYVRVNGKLDGPNLPVAMIHGGPGSSHASFLNLLALSDERAVILYDQLDSGLSDRPNDPANWSVARFVDELEAVRRTLGVRRWHVLGQSWGGTVALEYGSRQPASLAGLVLASPLVSTRSWISDASILRSKLDPDVRTMLSQCDPPAPITPACDRAVGVFYENYYTREPRGNAWNAYVAEHPSLRLNQRIYQAMWGSSEFVSTGSLRTYDGEPLLDKLDGKRTLFIAGQYDEARPSTVAEFAERASADFAVIPGSGHALFTDRPEESLGILRPWLAGQDPI
jgi:proline iminopeptidase/L-proline amide hydrolase